MRAGTAFAALLVTASFLAGCVSQVDNLIGRSTTPPTVGVAPVVPQIKVLAPLVSAVTATGGAWMKVGDSMTVSAAPPLNAVGVVTYQWMIGPIAGVGPYPTTTMPTKTPMIGNGGSTPLTFDTAGIWYLHCHPHPWMLNNVTVVDDGKAPQRVIVHFVDGPTQADYRYVPSDVTISKGSTIVYQNDGAQPHQTMLSHQDAPLKLLPLAGPTGDVKLDGNGWVRVLVAMTDAGGRVGYAEHDLYVTPTLPEPLVKKIGGGFPASAPSNVPAPVDEKVPMDTVTISPTRAGTLFLNFTAKDAAYAATSGATPNQAALDMHLKQSGQTQDVLTVDAKADGALKARVDTSTFTLTVKPRGGVNLTYEGAMTVIYDLIPPPKPTPYMDVSAGDTSMPGMVM
ncbi:MAG: hypothetical protein WDA16_06050 [Candidatus Thermoplasmatota archaeon]